VDAELPFNNPTCRLRLTFGKGGAARYVSHLDLARALERSLNRAGLPVAYTQGFNRRPRLSLAAALPLGYTSEAEVADVWLTEGVAPALFLERLRASIAPGITALDAAEVPLNAPSLQQQVAEALYRVAFLDAVDEAGLRAQVADMLAAESLVRERFRPKERGQTVDLRPLILDMHVADEGAEGPALRLRLVHTANQTGRPDDVLAALGFDPLATRVHRLALVFR
jgi:radical SAM-linked protein